MTSLNTLSTLRKARQLALDRAMSQAHRIASRLTQARTTLDYLREVRGQYGVEQMHSSGRSLGAMQMRQRQQFLDRLQAALDEQGRVCAAIAAEQSEQQLVVIEHRRGLEIVSRLIERQQQQAFAQNQRRAQQIGDEAAAISQYLQEVNPT